MVPGPPPHDEIARIRIDRPFLLDPAAQILDEFEIESPGETAGNLVLRCRKVGAIGVEPVRPQLHAAFGIDQLHVHAYLVSSASHAAIEQIADAELAYDLLRIERFALVRKGGGPPPEG